MSDESVFEKMDEEERIYAPEELPLEEQERVRAEEGQPQTLLDGTLLPPADAEDAPERPLPGPGAVPGMGITQGFGPVI